MQRLFFIATLLTLTSCALECIDKKTGMHKSSQTLELSKKNKVFNFEMLSDKTLFPLESGFVFKIKNAWVENSWRYECVDNKAVIQKDSLFQFVIDADYEGDAINSDYWLMNNHLGSVLYYNYAKEDTIRLTLRNKSTIIDTLIFVKKVRR